MKATGGEVRQHRCVVLCGGIPREAEHGESPPRPQMRDSAQDSSAAGLVVPGARFELARPCGHKILSLGRLPVPPSGHENESTADGATQLIREPPSVPLERSHDICPVARIRRPVVGQADAVGDPFQAVHQLRRDLVTRSHHGDPPPPTTEISISQK